MLIVSTKFHPINDHTTLSTPYYHPMKGQYLSVTEQDNYPTKRFRTSVALACFIVSCLITLFYIITERYEEFMDPFTVSMLDRRQARQCRETHGIFFGIFTILNKRAQRDVFRKYGFCNGDGNFTVRFILGRPSKMDEERVLTEESELFGDLEVLDCPENMNSGKTFHYFTHVYSKYPCYSFYAKVDDDAAFLPSTMTSYLLSYQSNQSVYVGKTTLREPWYSLASLRVWYQNNFGDMAWYFNVTSYNTGMFYALNYQAVSEMIELNERHHAGNEDVRTGHWMSMIGSRVINAGSRFHDHPAHCAGQDNCPNVTAQSLVLHQCKSPQRLMDGLNRMCSLQSR
jgi:Galactosyltransferase